MENKSTVENNLVEIKEKIEFLENLYKLRKNEEITDFNDGLILRYVEIDSSEIRELNENIALKGAVSYAYGLMGGKTGILILRDVVPKKFRRYVAIHETVEVVTGNHWYAVQDEFKAAEKELSKENFKEYCEFRLKMHKNNIKTVKEIRGWVSARTKRVLSNVQKELGIVLRKRPDQP